MASESMLMSDAGSTNDHVSDINHQSDLSNNIPTNHIDKLTQLRNKSIFQKNFDSSPDSTD